VQLDTVVVNYPADPACGNDDCHDVDERPVWNGLMFDPNHGGHPGMSGAENNPYANGGLLYSWDRPMDLRYHGFGSFADRLETRVKLREFARLQLGDWVNGKWYRISPCVPWKMFMEFSNPQNANPAPPLKWTHGGVIEWNDNGW
jgi:hypothetical protein